MENNFHARSQEIGEKIHFARLNFLHLTKFHGGLACLVTRRRERWIIVSESFAVVTPSSRYSIKGIRIVLRGEGALGEGSRRRGEARGMLVCSAPAAYARVYEVAGPLIRSWRTCVRLRTPTRRVYTMLSLSSFSPPKSFPDRSIEGGFAPNLPWWISMRRVSCATWLSFFCNSSLIHLTPNDERVYTSKKFFRLLY